MATFFYKGVNAGGQSVTGTIDAVDRKAAISELMQRGQFAMELAEGKAAGGLSALVPGKDKTAARRGGAIRSKELLAMMGQLATALKAGLPILNADRKSVV